VTICPSAKKKLFIHIGTPKTGTSSLQWFLYNNYDKLLEQGILYPKSIVESCHNPKQQPLFSCIHSGNANGLNALLQRISSEITPSAAFIIVSSEGFYHHTDELTENSWHLIRQLGRLYDLRIIVFLRPQADYIESMYRQYMKNPKGINVEYGSGLTIQELMARPKLKQNMDYYGSLMRWAATVGEDNVIVREYSSGVIDDFISLFDLDAGFNKSDIVRNTSITRQMAEILRRVNPLFDNKKRNILIQQMESFLRRYPVKDDKTLLSPRERSELYEHYRNGNDLVSQKWLHNNRLFSKYITNKDETWEPLEMDHEEMIGLLRKIGNNS